MGRYRAFTNGHVFLYLKWQFFFEENASARKQQSLQDEIERLRKEFGSEDEEKEMVEEH